MRINDNALIAIVVICMCAIPIAFMIGGNSGNDSCEEVYEMLIERDIN